MNTLQLIEQFTDVAQKVDTTVTVIIKSAEELEKTLLKLTDEEGEIVLADPDDLDPALFESFRKKSSRIIQNPDDKQMAGAKYGISDCFCAVARTGSVCVSITEKMGGSYSLYPRVHIAIVDSDTIVARPRDIFSQSPLKEKALNRDFIFVSGSSATADMGPLVRGVHGPGKLHVIFLK
jgi:L-lactate dehydrogenase complex protein LldG